VRQAEALASRKPPPPAPPQARREVDPDTAALEQELSERLGLRVQVVTDGRGGHVRIHYRTLDQLDSLIQLLSPTH
jgi:ParB family chromosome partitioning protein